MAKPFIPGDRWTAPTSPHAEHHEGDPFWDKIRQMGMEMRVEQGALERAITGAATAQEAKNLRRRLRRRIVQEGFPKISPFQSKDEIDRYLKGSPNGHTCLICGNAFRHLGIHLAKLHGVDLDEYRDQYHLPRTFGLACEETKALHREILSETVEAGNWKVMGSPEQAEMMRQKKRDQGAKAESAYKRAAQSDRQSQFRDEDYWRVIEVMRAEAVTLTEAVSRPAMPSASTFRTWKAQTPERQRAFAAAVEALPFPKQAAMNMLGERYNHTILALRREGKTIDEISSIVGVERVSINTRLRKLDPNHKQIVRHKTHCPNGHPFQVRITEDGRRIARCRICDAENKRRAAARRKPIPQGDAS